jgi:hypothetical protein
MEFLNGRRSDKSIELGFSSTNWDFDIVSLAEMDIYVCNGWWDFNQANWDFHQQTGIST